MNAGSVVGERKLGGEILLISCCDRIKPREGRAVIHFGLIGVGVAEADGNAGNRIDKVHQRKSRKISVGRRLAFDFRKRSLGVSDFKEASFLLRVAAIFSQANSNFVAGKDD